MSTALTVDSLRTILGRDVEEIHLTVAKGNAMGIDPESLAQSLGVPRDEVDALMETQDYKDVRLLVGSEMLQDKIETDASWDGIESEVVRKLHRKAKLENDTETLLKMAVVANRATRRVAPHKDAGPLDPSQAATRVPLTLTRRYTEKLNRIGEVVERSETQQISVLNGSAVNPRFEDVKQLLSGLPTSSGGESISATAHSAPAESQTERYREIVGDNDKPFTMDELLRAARRSKK